MPTATNRAIFLDRDGVINKNRPDYVKIPAELTLLPGAVEALRLLADLEMLIVVVSNQSAINRGLLSADTMAAITQHLLDRVRSAGGRIDATYFCPHRPDERCKCRKPRPGLLRQAARELDIDLEGSYLIGDALSDVWAAMVVGARPLMVLTGRGRQELAALAEPLPAGVAVFEDLRAAAGWICELERCRSHPAGTGAVG